MAEHFLVGGRVRVKPRSLLEQFQREGKYHHPISTEHLDAAGVTDTVKGAGIHRDGYALYELTGSSGIWHEECLEPFVIDAVTRHAIADALEKVADPQTWEPAVWRHFCELAESNLENELLRYVLLDLLRDEGLWDSRNVVRFRVKADPTQLEQYRREFRDVAAAIRANLSLDEAKKRYGF
jgi:hypothetical protein